MPVCQNGSRVTMFHQLQCGVSTLKPRAQEIDFCQSFRLFGSAEMLGARCHLTLVITSIGYRLNSNTISGQRHPMSDRNIHPAAAFGRAAFIYVMLVRRCLQSEAHLPVRLVRLSFFTSLQFLCHVVYVCCITLCACIFYIP